MQADLDNGYTRIANEILEALSMLDLSGREFRVAVVIMRKTYGFQKKLDWIALEQIAAATGIAKENVSRTISSLAAKKIIIKEGGGYTKKLGMNTKIGEWFHVEHIVENDNRDAGKQQNVENNKLSETTIENVEIDKAIVENDNGDVGFRQPQKKKETISKENNTKENFEILWSAFDGRFGNKGPKKTAFRAFEKLKPDKNLFDAMLAAVHSQTAEHERARETNRFKGNFQNVVRWITNERWTDEPDKQLAEPPAGPKSKSEQNQSDHRNYRAQLDLEEAAARRLLGDSSGAQVGEWIGRQ